MSRAAVVVGLLCLSSSTDATTIVLTIGNNEFSADTTAFTNTISPYIGFIDSFMNLDGPDILTELEDLRTTAQPGDVFIFHYAGHGGRQADANPLDEGGGLEGIIGLSADGGVTFPNPATDDQIAAKINGFAASVGILSIFDSCFAGEMVDGASDIARGLVIGTSDANCVAPGGSIFLPFWTSAWALVGGTFAADSNQDHDLTLDELFEHLDNIVGTNASNPYAVNMETAGHLAYVVAHVPEPSVVVLLGLATAGFARISLGRRHR